MTPYPGDAANGDVGWTFPANQAVQTANDGAIYSASMRCELPPSGPNGPYGIISVTTSSVPFYGECVGENACEGVTRCNFDGRCDEECKCVQQ